MANYRPSLQNIGLPNKVTSFIHNNVSSSTGVLEVRGAAGAAGAALCPCENDTVFMRME